MLHNVHDTRELAGLARTARRTFTAKSVHPRLADEAISDGWQVAKRNRTSVRLTRPKPHGALLEDRVWTLLYRMDFTHLSGDGGAPLDVTPKDPASPRTKIDVVALDDEVALAIECKSSERPTKRPTFAEELGKHTLVRAELARTVASQFPAAARRPVVLLMVTSNVLLSENDRKRSADAQVLLFDEHDLGYYEALVAHVGPAARYQFLADLLPGRSIPGLSMRIPAVRTKMGGYNCYTFSVSPKYLLKIAYVSHRSKGKASDIDTYQRMLRRSRLTKIREYIERDGIFPTNIVVNFSGPRIRFERIKQSEDQENGVLGWLDVRAAYKSAWIIDGQHRLYAYSGTERANRAVLSVLAFDGLPPSIQARLFIDINAEQKSVKQSLLQELYAELNWDAADPGTRVQAIVSKAVQVLDVEPDSPLCGRILGADAARSDVRCVSLSSIYDALERPGFFIGREKQGAVVEFGPLWTGDNATTLKRTVRVLKLWLGGVRTGAAEWWELGSAPGGGLAMNDSVTACIGVLRSVLQHADSGKQRLVGLSDEDVLDVLRPYSAALGEYLGSLTDEERRQFRALRGSQGQTARVRRMQQALQLRVPGFQPDGLAEYLEREKAQTNRRAKEVIDRIETTLQSVVLEELRREFGPNETGWWILGVPQRLRTKVTVRYEQDDGKRGGREYYFDLIDYRDIAVQNWQVFESILAVGRGSKERRMSWIVDVNEVRRLVAHASSAASVTVEQLGMVEEYERELLARVGGKVAVQVGDAAGS